MNSRTLLAVLGLAISSKASADHYVDINNASPQAPYDSWASASTDIQSAIDAATAGETVWVKAGTYSLSATITINKDITVKSESGWEATIIDGQSSVQCFKLSGVCEIDGFTIQNGSAGNGAGVDASDTTSIVRNCHIANNTASNSGGGVRKATIYHSTITNNTSNNVGGGAYQSKIYYSTVSHNQATKDGGALYQGTFVGSIVHDNTSGTVGGGQYRGGAYSSVFYNNQANDGGAIRGGTAVNCTIVDNHANGKAGGVYDGHVRNCIVYYNMADGGNANLQANDNLDHTCSPEATNAERGNITSAPLFLDRDNDNYRLKLGAGSPCIDAGSDGWINTTNYPYDPDLHDRILLTTVDMGAYETMDSDSDLLSDAEESTLYSTDPHSAHSDADGLDDYAEVITHATAPNDPDSDNDGLNDDVEVTYNLSPNADHSALISYLQSNGSTPGLYSKDAVLDLAIDDLEIEATNGSITLDLQLESSSNGTDWENLGSSVEWSTPAVQDKQLYRIRASQ